MSFWKGDGRRADWRGQGETLEEVPEPPFSSACSLDDIEWHMLPSPPGELSSLHPAAPVPVRLRRSSLVPPTLPLSQLTFKAEVKRHLLQRPPWPDPLITLYLSGCNLAKIKSFGFWSYCQDSEFSEDRNLVTLSDSRPGTCTYRAGFSGLIGAL